MKEQTPEICLEAVRQDGNALAYVKEQTPEICIEAVEQDSSALKYVKDTSVLEVPETGLNKSAVMSAF